MKFRNIVLPLLFGAFLTSCNLPKPNLDNNNKEDDEIEETERDEAFEDLVESFEDCDMTPEQAQEYIDAIMDEVNANENQMKEEQSYTIDAKSLNNDGEELTGKLQFDKVDHKFKLYSSAMINKAKVEYERGVWINKTDKVVEGYETAGVGQSADIYEPYKSDEEGLTLFNDNLLPDEETSMGKIGALLGDFDITMLSKTLLVVLKDPTKIPTELGDVTIKTKADNKGNLKAAFFGQRGEDDDTIVVKANFEFKNNLLVYAKGRGFIDEYKERLEVKFNYDKPSITFPEIL